MIVSKTPFRVSFAGGGTDIRSFYKSEPGAVLSTAIDQYMYVTVNKYFEDKVIMKYSRTEEVARAERIRHPLLREALRMTGIRRGVEITSMADIVGGTGLGSSSSFTVGVLNALYAYLGKKAPAERLAREACTVEIERVGEPIGKQDQYIAAYGGFQYIEFLPDERVRVTPVRCSRAKLARLNGNLMLFYTGKKRSASKLLAGMRRGMDSKRLYLRELKNLAGAARDSLRKGDIDDFGDILHHGWLLKKALHRGISNPVIDRAYASARRRGASGGKILGAGGGGFLLLFAKPARQASVRRAMKGWREVGFAFEPKGSRITYQDR